ncbi:MAG: DNA repair protein RadA [Desulfovibrio sp.]|nr:DNA repair protein RadA [Desulfovibrio sp.]MCA1986826.1 DNA repair protein RadA [Desulfovibrio sp.]
MKPRRMYVCTACGGASMRWQGQCPRCEAWNTLEERLETPAPAGGRRTQAATGPGAGVLSSGAGAAMSLGAVDIATQQHVSAGMRVLDDLLGQGMVRGSTVLMAGEPGVGKSTLLLQVAGAVAKAGHTVLYASGEEGLPQLKRRAERLGCLTDSLLALSTSSAEEVWQAVEAAGNVALVVLDSVQTVVSSQTEGLPGSVSQVRAVAAEGIDLARRCGPCLLFVGHVTKEGQIAGPKLLEHMVDTVLSLEGDRTHCYRLLRVLKNRFGPSLDVAVFAMQGQGLAPVEDPAALFLESRAAGLSGTALAMALDGQRAFALEAQALVSRSWLTIPRRTALGLDVNRLHLLLAVLEKRLGLSFGQQDVYAKVGGGFKLQDPGFDLALCAAILSSQYDQALPEQAAFFGEVDLNGRIRPVAGQEIRLHQARRLGLHPIFAAPGVPDARNVSTLSALQEALFGAAARGRGGRENEST